MSLIKVLRKLKGPESQRSGMTDVSARVCPGER